jgi:hypothetical protein
MKPMLTNSHIVCCAYTAGHTLQGVQARALMPHLTTVDCGFIMHVDTCNTGQMARNILHIAGMSSHQSCQLTGIPSNLFGMMSDEQALLSEAPDLLSMLS